MKKKYIQRGIFALFTIITILSIISAITVTGSGFIDLSSLARWILVAIAVVFGVLTIWISQKAFKRK